VTRLSDLDDKLVRLADGTRLGRVHDIRVEKGEVRSLDYGWRGWIERLKGKGKAQSLPWSAVREVRDDAIIVAPDERP
jgi:sporulation protein YlmC with PRC-barrel domain